MPLAASLHGPGTPGVSTNRRPDIVRARSTSIYSAMTSLSPGWIMWGPCLSTARRRVRWWPRLMIKFVAETESKRKTPKAFAFEDEKKRPPSRLVADHHLCRAREWQGHRSKRIKRVIGVGAVDAH